jgi:hypothetical protein
MYSCKKEKEDSKQNEGERERENRGSSVAERLGLRVSGRKKEP